MGTTGTFNMPYGATAGNPVSTPNNINRFMSPPTFTQDVKNNLINGVYPLKNNFFSMNPNIANYFGLSASDPMFQPYKTDTQGLLEKVQMVMPEANMDTLAKLGISNGKPTFSQSPFAKKFLENYK